MTAGRGLAGGWWSWAAVAGWLLLVYTAIPLAGDIREFVALRGGQQFFLWSALVVPGASAAWLVRAALRGAVVLTPVRTLGLLAVASLFIGLVFALRANPEESIHCAQYAVLAVLLFRALRRHLGGGSGYAAVILAGIGLGIVDELIQWLVPARTFDYRDIGINGLSVVLALLATAMVCGRRQTGRTDPRRGWRTVLHLAAVDLLLLLFCLANTPDLQHWLPSAVRIDEVTAEYGYRHRDPRAGVFFSRLDRAELARQDRERGAQLAPVLDRYAGEDRYRAFLARYPAHRDPLLFEARVHLFRRDRYAFLADQSRDESNLRQRYARIALGENLLMETVFPTVLAHSAYRWPPAMRATLRAWAGPAGPYRSPVSADLIIVASRPVLLTLVSGLLVLVLWGARRVGRGETR